MSNPTDLTQANDPRSRLAAIVAERGLIADHIEQINAADARLISAASPDAAAESELAALDAAASRAIEEWARNGGEGEPPNPDGAKREELLKRASKAQARARAVQGARSKLNDERNADGRRLAAIEAENRSCRSRCDVRGSGTCDRRIQAPCRRCGGGRLEGRDIEGAVDRVGARRRG